MISKLLSAVAAAFFASVIVVLATNVIPTPLPFIFQNGTVADATQVNSDLNTIVNSVNSGAASSGANVDITSLNALTGLTVSGTATLGTGAITTLNVSGVTTTQGDTNLASVGGVPGINVNHSTGLVKTYTAAGGAPYTNNGAIVVPIGVGIRAINIISVRGTINGSSSWLTGSWNVNTGAGGWDGSGNLTVDFLNNLNSNQYQVFASDCLSAGSKVLHPIQGAKGVGNFLMQWVDDTLTGTTCATNVDIIVSGGY